MRTPWNSFSAALAAAVTLTALCAPPVSADAVDVRRLPEVTDAMLAVATHPLDVTQATHALELKETPLARQQSEGGEQVVRLASDILFDFGSDTVRASASGRIADLLAPVPRGAALTVTGYTDSVGTEASNLDLSRHRAEAVARLVRAARPDLVLTVTGRGEADPVASNGTSGNDDPVGRAQNRRVELRYTG